MKQINETKRMQKLAGIITESKNTPLTASSLDENQLRTLINEVINEAAFSSTDVNAILKAAKTAVEAGKEVTVDGVKIGKVVPAAGAFIPADGSRPYPRIRDYYDNMSAIVIDGVPAELNPYEPKEEPYVDNRTPEEKEKAARDWADRYGPGGGVDTAFGRYTGD